MDMAEMYLTDKLTSQPAGEASSRAADLDNNASDVDDERWAYLNLTEPT